MAITTSIARHFAVRLIVMMIVMLVLGVWGVYDYAYAIPAKQQRFERYQVMQLTKLALEPQQEISADAHAEAQQNAVAAVDSSLMALVNEHAAKVSVAPFPADQPQWRGVMLLLSSGEIEQSPEAQSLDEVQRFTRVIDSIRSAGDEGWLKALLLCDQALRAPRQPNEQLQGMQAQVYTFVTNQINEISPDGSVPASPSKFDRAVQWMFIACLPCVLYFLWVYLGTVRRVYTLESDGTLKHPEGVWPSDEIAGIDMGRWMAKSTATVQHADGKTLLLDDYKHKDMHLIVGALASRFAPEDWTPDAKPIKKGVEADDMDPTQGAGELADGGQNGD